MLPSVLLLLLIRGAQAAYYGAVFTYSVGNLQPGGYPAVKDFKASFSSCEEFDSRVCYGDCSGMPVYPVDEIRGEWCQKGYTWSYYPSYLGVNNGEFDATNWIGNRNGIETSKAVLHFDYRKRSDINKPNSSPQTTIIPTFRVPSNCQRNINLSVSDPDGDDIRCRYAADPECFTCTPPPVLNVSSSCSLSFSPTNSSVEGPYAVQMVVEDFPRHNVTLTDSFGVQSVKTTSAAISRIPVQFVFRVDPAAPSCTEGEYLPRFLPPTPEHGAQIFTNFNQALKISIRAEASQAVISELLFSGPPRLAKSSSGSGNFTLTWTPPASDGGLKQTICFVVQANSSGSVYQSVLRCVFVKTGNTPVPPPTTAAPTPPPPSYRLMSSLTTQPSVTPPPTTTTLTTTTSQPTTTTSPPTTTTTSQLTTNHHNYTSTYYIYDYAHSYYQSTPPTTTSQTTTSPPTTTNQPTTTTTLPRTSITTSALDAGPYYVLALNAKISTTLSMETDSGTIINLIKDELIRQGLPSDIIVELLSSGAVKFTTVAP